MGLAHGCICNRTNDEHSEDGTSEAVPTGGEFIATEADAPEHPSQATASLYARGTSGAPVHSVRRAAPDTRTLAKDSVTETEMKAMELRARARDALLRASGEKLDASLADASSRETLGQVAEMTQFELLVKEASLPLSAEASVQEDARTLIKEGKEDADQGDKQLKTLSKKTPKKAPKKTAKKVPKANEDIAPKKTPETAHKAKEEVVNAKPKPKAKSRLKKRLTKEQAVAAISEAKPVLEKPDNMQRLQKTIKGCKNEDELSQMMNMAERLLPIVWEMVGHVFKKYGFETDKQMLGALMEIKALAKNDDMLKVEVDTVMNMLGQ